MSGARCAVFEEGEATAFGLATRLLPGIRIPGSETWEAFWDGGPRKSDGGGSLCFPLLFGD